MPASFCQIAKTLKILGYINILGMSVQPWCNLRKVTFVIFFYFSYITISFSQVVLKGNAPTYAKSEIIFYVFADPFTETEKEIGKAKIGPDGEFTTVLPINEITYIFSHLGIFRGFMYVEPNKAYQIAFPDKVEKTQAEKLNPFFEETQFQFAIKEQKGNDLNLGILTFDDAYSPYFSKFAKNIYSRNKKSLLDSTITDLKKIVPDMQEAYLQNYVNYKIGFLKHLAYQQKSKSVSKEYFQHKPVLYNNTAYIELFNQVYGKYFYFFGRTNYGKSIFDDINVVKSYTRLTQTLTKDSVLKEDSLRELVILKNVHDEFYASNFSRSGLLTILDSLSADTKITLHKEIATLIKNKVTRLMVGYEPPPFTLKNKEGKEFSLSDFKNSYVYLNFCNCSSYTCIKEFDVLQKLAEKYQDKLIIITIATDDSLQAMQSFLEKYPYKWLFLHFGNQPDILEKYDIRAYPTYFLVGPNGKLVFSPANSPGENFELYLFQVMRSNGDL